MDPPRAMEQCASEPNTLSRDATISARRPLRAWKRCWARRGGFRVRNAGLPGWHLRRADRAANEEDPMKSSIVTALALGLSLAAAHDASAGLAPLEETRLAAPRKGSAGAAPVVES